MQPHPRSKRWAVVLAGGEGERMKPFIRRWLGSDVPKQYCVFSGTRSMFRHTLERASHLVGRERISAVVGRGHMRWAAADAALANPALTFEQPAGRGTAPGVLLPAALILAQNPDATLLILPSDHFIFPTGAFLERASEALQLAEDCPDRLVLLGADADRAETDYGWVAPGPAVRHRGTCPAYAAEAFEEKPPAGRARQFLARGLLWNTMIVAVRGAALWDLAWQKMPGLMPRFEALRRLAASPRGRRHVKLAARLLYAGMPEGDFSRDLLAVAPEKCLVVPMNGIVWNDWGRPSRVRETLSAIGARRRPPPPPRLAATPPVAA
ncbi:MAG: NTP transferase domain-containing protein [Elusimicrobia bacterium]|nr:NTP transferase domain-containing protein [Elusimicrobiota bacterium]